MARDTRPPFAAYLLPSLSVPFRRRQSSTTSTSSEQPPSLSFSPRSSISTSPGTSPPSTYPILSHYTFAPPQKGLLYEALQQAPLSPETTTQPRLHRAQPNTLRCVTCATDIAFASQIVSKGFTGRHGRAYLVGPAPPSSDARKDGSVRPGMLMNTRIGRNVSRELLTGTHVVADVSCVICTSVLGWKYVDAKELAQKYKIGKFILEMKRVVQGVGWEDGEPGEEIEDEAINHEYSLGEDVEGDKDDGAIVFDEDDEDECEDLFAGIWNAEAVAKRRARKVSTR